ncbi:WD40 repeat-like protein [Coemansia spiralis]|uniref:WD40 repeat-like protein n=2 Tax=Coemansia TaxID=4863 RepID=A0A9W8L1R8_9FUNG|nr:WD40 repeat-like protein [Coemansia umbellata]KAJ2621806.1 WD40 repeat-like protein [Coemansia sp. RSA 1358]KAJ2681193.1 WD40 repeat-like protein [Coemansia spiralis]
MSFTKKEYFAPAPVTTRGQPVRLSADPKGEQFVYASGKTIVVRNLSNLEKAWEYTEHTSQTTVAKFSPSGYYIASGDVSGRVRIWDIVNDDHILKSEFQPISGRISDISWDPDSQRIVAVGDGKGSFGHFFTFDSGNTVGTITGHSKVINACSMRQRRPFRAVTCSDDGTSVFYHGAPYKFVSLLSDHSGFVQDAKYAPSDDYFVTVGADKKIFLYDGKTGELVRQVAAGSPEEAHTGSISAVAWSPDSKYILTSSGDRTCKFWDIESDRLIGTVKIGGTSSSPDHQQVGNLWAGEHIISLSLSGDINVLKMDAAEPVKVVYGHQKSITAASLTQSKLLYTGSYDGRLCVWDFSARPSSAPLGVAALVQGSTGDTRPEDAAAAGDLVAFGFLDDTLRFVENSAIVAGGSVSLSAAPRSVAIDSTGTVTIAVLANDDLVVISKGKATHVPVKETSAAARAVAIDHGSSLVAVGFQDNSVHLYKLQDAQLAPAGAKVTAHQREITSLAFSPTGDLLASGDSAGKIIVSKAQSGELVTSRWGSHTARIYGISWSPDGAHAASASLDGHVIVWSVEQPARKIFIRNAHMGGAAAVSFIDNETVVSAGADGGVKVWGITYA